MAKADKLQLFSETKLDPRPHAGLLTYNPSIELFARAAGPRTLEIWRANGQSILKSTPRVEKESVEALRWKADGEFLAVGWSDGVVRLMGLENSKAVHQITVCEGGKTHITCIGWARTHAGRRPAPSARNQTSTWDQVLRNGLNDSETGSTLDLPSELAFLEVETALPKLSPLPASGGSGDDMYVFTSRASLDYLFRPFSPENSDVVDVMLVGTSDGKIHLSIYDSFIIGSFPYSLPPNLAQTTHVSLLHHTSHPDITTHSLLLRPSSETKSKELYIVPLDLTFIYSSPENLSLLASKTTTLQKLLRYVRQVQMHMTYEWQSTRELPGRFIHSINETLREAGTYGEMDVGQAMYHTVVTGHTFPEVKEWLVDQLAERGHKRWDKAVTTGLESLRNLIHENFLPALERIAIILSRLLGIARFHESKDEIGFTSTQITKVMDIVSSLMLVGHKILLLVMEELDVFHAFSTWLRYEIDRLASSSVSDELTEKEATMEHGKILTYIQQYMRASPLRFYLSKVSTEDSDRSMKLTEDGTSVLDMLDKQIKKQESGHPQIDVIAQIEFLGLNLQNKADLVFDGIAEAEKRGVRFGRPTKIELDHPVAKIDMKMCAVQNEENTIGVTYTALTSDEQKNMIHIFRTETSIVNGISSTVTTQYSGLKLGDAEVLDLKFLNDDTLLVLLSLRDSLRIIRIPYQSVELGYVQYTAGAPVSSHALSTEQVTSVFPNLLVPQSDDFRPVQMEVKRASTARGKIPARACLLGDDLQTYRVFALPETLL